MPVFGAIEGVDEDEFRVRSIWDLEEDGQEEGLAERGVRAAEDRAVEGPGSERERRIPGVPYPFGHMESACRALAALDERLADAGARRRWYAAVRRGQAAEQGRLCGFAVDGADACLVEFDPLAAGQSRLNGMWIVGRGLKAARLAQRGGRGGVLEGAVVSEIGVAALGRWGAEECAGADEVCDEWRALAGRGDRGLLVFADALSRVGSWRGLDAEERAVLMAVLAPRLGRLLVPTRWCSLYLMGEVAWAPALWEERARAGGAGWVQMCLEGVEGCARRGYNVLRQLELRYGLALEASPARRSSHSYGGAVDLVFESPLVDVGSMMRGLGLSRAGAQRLIGELVGAGVLRMSSRGRGRRYDAWQIGDVWG